MRKFLFVITLMALPTIFSATASAACTFTTIGNVKSLDADCTTTSTILIPDGMTVEGNGFTITADDPAGGHFVGAVLMNGGTTANVTNITITTDTLLNECDEATPDKRLRGILFQGASGSITSSQVLNIKQGDSGCQEGNAIEVRNLGHNPDTSSVTIDGNTITGYQKTGIVANGNVNVTITDNMVDGGGPVGYIARNGIQFGYGAKGMAKKNTVNGNGYTGTSTVSGGILVVGGPGYSPAFPNFCVGIQIVQNSINGNDIGVYISQYEAGFSGPPTTATNIKVVNNTITKTDGRTNNYYGGYQAGVSDVGNNDKIINNNISGSGYDGALGDYIYSVDADPAYSTKPKVHAND
jgi:hypothetical protein